MAHIVIGISSGIAAFKAVDLIKLLKKDGHNIYVMMTKKAMHIASPGKIEEITGYPVFLNLFEDSFSYEQILKRKKVDHIEVAKRADIFVVVPATANTLAKLASGIADDFMTTTVLATSAPVLLCPSMNNSMWAHPATQKNLQTVNSYGYEVLPPDAGHLACGTDGIGRLPDVSVIKSEIESILKRKHLLKGKKVLVTGGGTSEPIDLVRTLSNRSSGKMGLALAESAYRMGATVTYLQARSAPQSYYPMRQDTFVSQKDLNNLLKTHAASQDIIIHAAAVSDFTMDTKEEKLSSDTRHQVTLIPSQKTINSIKKLNPHCTLVGFKAYDGKSTKNVKKTIEPLFHDAGADWVVANDISDRTIGFESDENEVSMFSKKGQVVTIQKASKQEIARNILKIISGD